MKSKQTTAVSAETSNAIAEMADHWAKLDAVTAHLRTAKRPDVSITIEEYADRHGISRKTAENHLSAAVRSGKMIRSVVSIPSKSGHNHRTNVYSIAQ